MRRIFIFTLFLFLFVFTACVKDVYYTVKFYNFDGELAKEERVLENASATAPLLAPVEGFTLTGWSEDFSKVTSNIDCYPTYEKNVYTVIFVDVAGNELKKQQVEHGLFASAPTAPAIEGKNFVSWDKEYTSVKSDLTIKPIYDDVKFMVAFYDWDNTLLKSDFVIFNQDATPPVPPTRVGYTFTGWDKEYKNIKEVSTLKAQYKINSYNVKFVDYDGKEIETQEVEHGKNAVAPISPTRKGYTFTGWDKQFQNITDEVTITAMYDLVNYIVTFSENLTDLQFEKVKFTSKTEFVDELYNDLFNWLKNSVGTVNGLTFKDDTYTLVMNSVTITWKTPADLKSVDIYDYEKTLGNLYYKPFTRVGNELYNPDVDNKYFLHTEPYRTKYSDLDRYFLNVLNTAYTSYDKGYKQASNGRVQIFFRFQQWIKGTSIPSLDLLPSKMVGGTTVTIPANINYNITSAIEISDPIYQDLVFLGWYDNIYGAGNKYTKIEPGTTGNITLYAKWDTDLSTHKIIFVDMDNSLVQEYYINPGETPTPPTMGEKTGYTFTGWDKDFTNITNDTTFKSVYTPVEYTITYNKNIDVDGVTLPTSPTKYIITDKFNLPDAKLDGYFFAGWYLNSDLSGEKVTKTDKCNLVLYAKWIKIGVPSQSGIELVASSHTVQVGRIINLYPKKGTEYLSQSSVKYQLSDERLARIDENGYLTGLKAGTLTVLITHKDGESTMEITITNQVPEVKWVGHRGSGGPIVPNAATAFELGGQRGYYAMECDVRVSADGVYYVCHDDVFYPYLFVDSSLHEKAMASYTWAQLKDLQIKGTYNGTTYYAKLATVEEYLEICKKYNAVAVIELKYTTGINTNDQSKLAGLVELVKRMGMYENAIFMTSMKNCLTYLRNNYPDSQLQFLSGANTTTDENINWCIDNRISLDATYEKLTAAIVNKMHAAGLYVNAYTVNSQTEANRLISIGVDMITTDHLGVK